jgi:hypothetical protein
MRDAEKSPKIVGGIPAIIEHEIALGYLSNEVLRSMSRIAIQHLVVRSALSILSACVAMLVRGDTIELANGGRIEGRVTDAPSDRNMHVIELTAGGRLTLPRSQVARIDSTSEAEREYTELARTSPDTVDAHWKLAEWCRAHKLRDLSQQHLARILELEPNHGEARSLLGFRNQGGQWMTRDELMAARGLVKYDGKYVTRQHIELSEREREIDVSQANWKKRLEQLRRALMDRRADKSEQALAEVRAIRDPMAAAPLVALIRQENDRELKRLWIEAAAELDNQLVLDTLVQLSLEDPDEELRFQCLDFVIRSGKSGIVTPYIRALKSRDNAIINRAGAAIGQIGDREAIGPLIDALVTKHKYRETTGNSADQHAYTFTDGGGFSFGSAPPKIKNVDVRNPEVLGALVKLAGGVSFDYDQDQWRTWLAAQAKLNAVDVRRDE